MGGLEIHARDITEARQEKQQQAKLDEMGELQPSEGVGPNASDALLDRIHRFVLDERAGPDE